MVTSGGGSLQPYFWDKGPTYLQACTHPIPSHSLSSPTWRMELNKQDLIHRRPNPHSRRVRSVFPAKGTENALKHLASLRAEHSFWREPAGVRRSKDIISINLQKCGHSSLRCPVSSGRRKRPGHVLLYLSTLGGQSRASLNLENTFSLPCASTPMALAKTFP